MKKSCITTSVERQHASCELVTPTIASASADNMQALMHYKDDPGAGFGKQYVTATNAYEAIQMAKALYGRLLMSEGASLV